MDKIRALLEKYDLYWEHDENLEFPHIVYKQKMPEKSFGDSFDKGEFNFRM